MEQNKLVEGIINKGTLFLSKTVSIFEIFTYIVIIIIISISIIKSSYLYFKNKKKDSLTYFTIKIQLSNAVTLALSFILAIEVLKLIFIKTYRQLILVACLVLLKLIMRYFISKEVESDKILKNKYENRISLNVS